MSGYLYVCLKEDNLIASYAVEEGLPVNRQDFSIEGGPGPMALDPSGRFLFVGLRESTEIACVQITPPRTFELIAKTLLPGDPCFVGTDSRGRYIFMAYYGAGLLSVHGWEPSTKTINEMQVIRTEKMAHSLFLSPDDKYAYAPHTGPNRIYLYELDGDTGRLAARKPPFASPEAYLEPRHLCFHPSYKYMYVVNEASSTVSAYDFDRRNGDIESIQTVSTLPAKSGVESWAAEVKISPDGKHLYASNRGHDSIAHFNADAKTGRLYLMGCVPAPKKPRSFDISGDGRFLYAAGEASGELVSYKLDEKTGRPEEIARELAGSCPMWVMAVPAR